MSSVDFSQIRVFIMAAEENSFSAAARKLHMSQSAVSQNIHALEQTYGVELFIRRGRSVVLSEAGENILPTSREVLRTARTLEDQLKNVNNEIGGELLIGCSTSAGKYLMPSLLSNFQKKYPAVNPKVKIMSRDSVHERLLNENIPMGVSSKEFEHHSLESVPLFEDRVILIVPIHHPWAEYGYATPDDLLEQRLILREEHSGTCETVMHALKPFGITPDMLNVVMELGNPEAIEMAVERGVGIAFVSEMVAARGMTMGRVKKVAVEGLDLQRQIYMARHIGFPFTRAQSLFWDFAKAQYEMINSEIWESLVNFETVQQFQV
ncbi:MAG TPA: LysR family transcriptional regulator [Anaerolineales bacterium]|nr:LysR family transcriptional regulator [Anaerolineales bacterium]